MHSENSKGISWLIELTFDLIKYKIFLVERLWLAKLISQPDHLCLAT